ncbi:MAG: GerMN domain-containing protein [Oscillospiraceae bacterium]|nr:GerMN domain-containing protein [Oscillospiraceae bacterium]
MRRTVALLLALLVLLTACAAEPEQPSPDDYALYYAASLGASAGGDAIDSETHNVPGSASMDSETLAQALVCALLDGPRSAVLQSPFPEGTALQRLSVARGRALVDLSEQYGRLSGIDLSIADACLTLTLTQLSGVYAVHVTADGRELPYRETQLLTAADALLSSGEDVMRAINVSLYFLDKESGELRAQAQTLALYEGQTRVSVVLAALERGPAGDDTLGALLREEATLVSSHTENGVCYAEINGLGATDEAHYALAVESVARSLLSLDGVDEVNLLVDGAQIPPVTAEPPQE